MVRTLDYLLFPVISAIKKPHMIEVSVSTRWYLYIKHGVQIFLSGRHFHPFFVDHQEAWAKCSSFTSWICGQFFSHCHALEYFHREFSEKMWVDMIRDAPHAIIDFLFLLNCIKEGFFHLQLCMLLVTSTYSPCESRAFDYSGVHSFV